MKILQNFVAFSEYMNFSFSACLLSLFRLTFPGATFIQGGMCIPESRAAKYLLKVSKFQKQNFLFSFGPKNELHHFLNSALAYKMSNKKMKGTLLY